MIFLQEYFTSLPEELEIPPCSRHMAFGVLSAKVGKKPFRDEISSPHPKKLNQKLDFQ